MKTLKLMTRWNVLREVLKLLSLVGDAAEDQRLTQAERGAVMKQMWVVIKTYQRTPQKRA